jgi:hypothetical protein
MTSTPPPITPDDRHFRIAEKAETALKAMANGNGLSSTQLRLVKHDTAVHALPGTFTVQFKGESARGLRRGRPPAGEELTTEEAVAARIETYAASFAADSTALTEIERLRLADPGRGFAIPDTRVLLNAARTSFFRPEPCPRCAGRARMPCVPCGATGQETCPTCQRQGTVQCRPCGGTGQYRRGDGSLVPCTACPGNGRSPCGQCNSKGTQLCRACGGTMILPCPDCEATGWQTHVYDTTVAAHLSFVLNREACDAGALSLAETIGLRALGTEAHAEILPDPALPPKTDKGRIDAHLVALFPVAEAEFSADGKPVRAQIAGLQGRIARIDSFLDPLVKPGLQALSKASSGGIGSRALLDVACKFRLVTDTLKALPAGGKRHAYDALRREYGDALSAKYAKAAVKYADDVLLSLLRRPRLIGLAAGTLLAGLIAWGWFSLPPRGLLRSLLDARALARHILAADIAAWLLGWGIAVLCVRLWATRAVRRALPGNARGKMQAAGDAALYAFGLAFLAWAIAAFLSPVRPEWLTVMLARL